MNLWTRRLLCCAAFGAAASFLAACGGRMAAAPELPPTSNLTIPSNVLESCATLLPGDYMRCFAQFRTDVPNGRDAMGVLAGATPSGYGPAQLQDAYALPSSNHGTGQIIAIVDAYNDPNADADLGVYRKQYGLPVCSTSNGCFSKVSQTGSKSLFPPDNGGWAQEESLDLDVVSAVCPNCHIILVEANSAAISDLDVAENEAVKLGANIVSNSFGGPEYTAMDPAYSHPTTVLVASAGDNGFAGGPEQPCTFLGVVCAGGTSLKMAQNSRGWTEVVWNDLATHHGATGSGCSILIVKPAWQTDKGCTKRDETDSSFDADPQTGVAVYDSYPYMGFKGWLVFGGTSVSSPGLAAVYGLAGNAKSVGRYAPQRIWHDRGSGLNAITSGNNGTCSQSYKYICTAGTNDDGVYSGPGGWGTPKGLSDY